jgi:hypothetical protein
VSEELQNAYNTKTNCASFCSGFCSTDSRQYYGSLLRELGVTSLITAGSRGEGGGNQTAGGGAPDKLRTPLLSS